MAQQLHTTATLDLSFLMILFLLSYVLSSAPRYVRDMKKPAETSTASPRSTLREAGRVYAVEPYLKAWKLVKKSVLPANSLDGNPNLMTGIHSLLVTENKK